MTVPLLFLHGWAMRGAVFDDIAQRLGDGFECHAPDLPGHGARCEETGGLAAATDVAHEWIERLDRPVLIGWSMGAAVAWHVIGQHGTANLRGLVTIDMSPRMVPDTDWELGLLRQSREAILATSERIEPEWSRMAASISRGMFAEDSDPVLTRNVIRDQLLAQNPRHLKQCWNDLVAMDARQIIAKVDIPYLVCFGKHSRLYGPGVAHWITSQAQAAKIMPFENSGHSPHLEEPDAFCRALVDFIAIEGAKSPQITQARMS